jgi:hypothetical protein
VKRLIGQFYEPDEGRTINFGMSVSRSFSASLVFYLTPEEIMDSLAGLRRDHPNPDKVGFLTQDPGATIPPELGAWLRDKGLSK